MTSPDVSQTLLQALDLQADERVAQSVALRFTTDFDSTLPFPDLPFDAASPAARYADTGRAEAAQVVADAGRALHDRAPRAFALVACQLDRVMLRRCEAVPGAASSSNRDHVGVCVLTNVHLPPDRALICVEALVHESVHQYLYRMELLHGDFCDLAAPGRHRSPWSGNRIPLHSLVHACFVYYALLGLWCRFARGMSDPGPVALVRDRLARILFGYHYLRPLIEARGPAERIHPSILDTIRRIAAATRSADVPSESSWRWSESLRPRQDDPWLERIAGALAQVVPPREPALVAG